MNSSLTTIIWMGLAVFIIRSIAFIFAEHIRLSVQVKDTLSLLPPAILSVIIASDVIGSGAGNENTLPFSLPYLLAVFATLLISLKVRNFLLVIVLGYLSFLIFRYLTGMN